MIDGSQYELSEEITLDKNLKHNISIIVDRLVVKPDIEKRLTDSVENVLDLADVPSGGRHDGRKSAQLQPELFLPGLRHQHGGD